MREIRKLDQSEFEHSLELSQYAFQYTLSEEDKEKRKNSIVRQEVWGEFEGESLTSKVHVYPLSIFVGNKEVKMGGIAGVATWPEYRRGGSVSRLLDFSLRSMKEKGQAISLLHPFDINFYRRYGWELCFSLKKYTIEKPNLHFMASVNGYIRRLNLKDDLNTINHLYEKFAANYNGMLKRDEYWWENHVYSKGFQFGAYYNSNGNPLGYLFYKVSDKMMDIQEFVYLNSEARRGLWNFVCQHDSMIEKVKIVVPEDDELLFLLQNPKNQIEIVPYFMARIVDAKSFLCDLSLNKLKKRLVIHIKDEQAEWNNVSLSIENGLVQETTPEEKGVTVSIQLLTAVLLRSQTALFLHEAGLIIGSLEDIQLLERIIPNRTPCIIDFF